LVPLRGARGAALVELGGMAWESAGRARKERRERRERRSARVVVMVQCMVSSWLDGQWGNGRAWIWY
jgi:hypothetical protein